MLETPVLKESFLTIECKEEEKRSSLKSCKRDISSQTTMNYLRVWVNLIEWVVYFEIENLHINLRLKEVHVSVNGIPQFIHFVPLSFFCNSVCSYLCLLLWVRPSTWPSPYVCSPYVCIVQSAPSTQALRLNTYFIPSRWQQQICCRCRRQHQGCQKASRQLTQISEQLRHI